MNPTHDLVVCLSGKGSYQIAGTEVSLTEGEAMLIPAYTRFKGRHGGGEENYIGVAQHFALELFDRGDILPSMSLHNKVRLSDWNSLKPMITLYRNKSSTMATTVLQHHQFMVVLLAFLQDAFIEWKDAPNQQDYQDQLSMQIMLVAAQLSTDPLGNVAKEVLAKVPYNADYFRRAFCDRMGLTPKQFRESKRMEFAIHCLQKGQTVKQVSGELGYRDQYFFSRQFKRYIGTSPSKYRVTRDRNGADQL